MDRNLPGSNKQQTIIDPIEMRNLRRSEYHPHKPVGCTIQQNVGCVTTPLDGWAPARIEHFCASSQIRIQCSDQLLDCEETVHLGALETSTRLENRRPPISTSNRGQMYYCTIHPKCKESSQGRWNARKTKKSSYRTDTKISTTAASVPYTRSSLECVSRLTTHRWL